MAAFCRVALAFSGVLASIAFAGPVWPRVDQTRKPCNATFDYVVVGGGAGGLAVAARLAEFASVAVVEAGGYYQVEYGNASVIPLLSLTAIDVIDPSTSFPRRPEIDWELLTEPQNNAAGQVVHYAQGKTLGGSTALNTMSYVRSSASAYRRWADIVGDDSYTFDKLLPFFEKSEHLTPPDLVRRNTSNATPEYDASVHGTTGPLEVSWNKWVDPTINGLAHAAQAAGIGVNPAGWSAGVLDGGSWNPATIAPSDATRESSQTSYLDYASRKTELKVYPHTMANKVLFDGTTARGVSVTTNGTTYVLSARKEIIVSGGTFHSPQILLVSGIGSKATLEALDIPVVVDLPGVGRNLYDPVTVNVAHFVNTQNGQALVANASTEPEARREYYEEAAGPYSSVAGYISYTRIDDDLRSTLSAETRAKLAALPPDGPELQFIGGTFLSANGSAMGSISATVCNTFSAGSVTINSSSASDPPVIDLGWFSDEADAHVLVAGIRRVRRIWATDVGRAVSLGAEVLPGDGAATDGQLLAYAKANVHQIWHPTSTCAMGREGDENAVVDSEARVFGVAGLRVVDASVFPFAIPGHPQASVYMLAEKIAHAIRTRAGSVP